VLVLLQLQSRRASFREVSTAAEHPSISKTSAEECSRYLLKIASDLCRVADDVEAAVSNQLLPDEPTAEGIVAYLTLLGDCGRYRAELHVLEPGDRAETVKRAAEAYALALAKGKDAGLEPAHPVLLRAALNYAVFTFSVMGSIDDAVQIARSAYDLAVDGLQLLDERECADAVAVMDTLKRNVVLWIADPLADPVD
jgi:14-3-3 protein epsilon